MLDQPAKLNNAPPGEPFCRQASAQLGHPSKPLTPPPCTLFLIPATAAAALSLTTQPQHAAPTHMVMMHMEGK